MENIQSSISLPLRIEALLRAMAQQKGQTKNSLILEAVSHYLERQSLLEIEKKLQAKGRLLGIDSEEELVRLVRTVRNSRKK